MYLTFSENETEFIFVKIPLRFLLAAAIIVVGGAAWCIFAVLGSLLDLVLLFCCICGAGFALLGIFFGFAAGGPTVVRLSRPMANITIFRFIGLVPLPPHYLSIDAFTHADLSSGGMTFFGYERTQMVFRGGNGAFIAVDSLGSGVHFMKIAMIKRVNQWLRAPNQEMLPLARPGPSRMQLVPGASLTAAGLLWSVVSCCCCLCYCWISVVGAIFWIFLSIPAWTTVVIGCMLLLVIAIYLQLEYAQGASSAQRNPTVVMMQAPQPGSIQMAQGTPVAVPAQMYHSQVAAPSPYGSSYGAQPSSYGAQPSSYNAQPSSYSAQPSSLPVSHGSFVAKEPIRGSLHEKY